MRERFKFSVCTWESAIQDQPNSDGVSIDWVNETRTVESPFQIQILQVLKELSKPPRGSGP